MSSRDSFGSDESGLDTILVTGGAGFIGSNFVLNWLRSTDAEGRQRSVVNVDKLTYAGNLASLTSVCEHPNYAFVQGDICDGELMWSLLEEYHPYAVVHFAAESHVDRSISEPEVFLGTNVSGTLTLLQAARRHYEGLQGDDRRRFRFLHISTDEVYGTLSANAPAFHEGTPYAPNSPYAASKASSDHFVRAWHHTYGLPTLITNCSNNYGPHQFPEKLIPLILNNALQGKPLPIYGDGQQIRDWLFVGDHCSAIERVLADGTVGETYNVGGGNQRSNLEVVTLVCALLDELQPNTVLGSYARLITFVEDRPGHDRRYAIDARKLELELNWSASESFESGLRKTVRWYLDNQAWVEGITSGEYRSWMEQNYGSRSTIQKGEGMR